jgi:4-hydroxy-3-polyprenylbenzoate decarboxylase
MSDRSQRQNDPSATQRICLSSGTPVNVAWTGASGIAYGVRLVEVLLRSGRDVNLVHSQTVTATAPAELGRPVEMVLEHLRAISCEGSGDNARGKLNLFNLSEYSAPMASGSAVSAGMAICPCSMSTAGRLAAGAGDTLLTRAADVCLKERRPLIVVPREAPLATHHLENLARLSRLGAVVLPAAPGFYHQPQTIDDLIDFIVQRICDHLGVEVALTPRWGVANGADGHERPQRTDTAQRRAGDRVGGRQA